MVAVSVLSGPIVERVTAVAVVVEVMVILVATAVPVIIVEVEVEVEVVVWIIIFMEDRRAQEGAMNCVRQYHCSDTRSACSVCAIHQRKRSSNRQRQV